MPNRQMERFIEKSLFQEVELGFRQENFLPQDSEYMIMFVQRDFRIPRDQWL